METIQIHQTLQFESHPFHGVLTYLNTSFRVEMVTNSQMQYKGAHIVRTGDYPVLFLLIHQDEVVTEKFRNEIVKRVESLRQQCPEVVVTLLSDPLPASSFQQLQQLVSNEVSVEIKEKVPEITECVYRSMKSVELQMKLLSVRHNWPLLYCTTSPLEVAQMIVYFCQHFSDESKMHIEKLRKQMHVACTRNGVVRMLLKLSNWMTITDAEALIDTYGSLAKILMACVTPGELTRSTPIAQRTANDIYINLQQKDR